MHQNPFSAGDPPRSPLGERTSLPQIPWLGRGHPFPSLRGFDASISAPMAPRFTPDLNPYLVNPRLVPALVGLPEIKNVLVSTVPLCSAPQWRKVSSGLESLTLSIIVLFFFCYLQGTGRSQQHGHPAKVGGSPEGNLYPCRNSSRTLAWEPRVTRARYFPYSLV